MPVLSPHRSSSSGLSGSYRSSLGSSYYGGYQPRIYNERFSTRTYTDADGRTVFSRSGSITEDGITRSFREETREGSLRRDSMSRDSGISSIREGSILDTIPRRERDISIGRSDRGSRLSSLSVAETMEEFHKKYSPTNYVPTCHRKNDISRSKSINDIGLPPLENKKKVTDSLNSNNSVVGVSNFANNTNKDSRTDNNSDDDNNGNRPSVSEIRKKFDTRASSNHKLVVEGTKISDNRFKKQDSLDAKKKTASTTTNNIKPLEKDISKPFEKNGTTARKTTTKSLSLNKNEGNEIKGKSNGELLDAGSDKVTNNKKSVVDGEIRRKDAAVNGANDRLAVDSEVKVGSCPSGLLDKSKLKVSNKDESSTNGAMLGGSGSSLDFAATDVESADSLKASRTNNFASYIPTKDYNKGDSRSEDSAQVDNGIVDDGHETDNRKATKSSSRYYDVTASPRLNRASISGAGTSGALNNVSRASLERDDDRSFDNRISGSPVKHQGLNGLKNIGNTCFMNSVIQCLSNTKLLLEYVRKDSYINDINTTISGMKGALIKAFAQVIKELWSEDPGDRVVNTVSLKSQIQRFAPRFMGCSQQDAQEFLRYLLEGLHEDVNRVSAKPAPILTEIDEKLSDAEKASESWQRYLRMDNSKIVDIFVGQLKSTLRCTHCGHCSVTFDPFWDLSLPIPQKAGSVRLSQCFESFTREETLDGDEKPTCSKCKERRKCTKSFSIQKFPKILVIHLKRFSPTERYRGKLSVTVDFPLEGLDLKNYCADNSSDCSRYNLYAISNHSGTTYSGHYTAYCRHPYFQTWHTYNDSRVSSISSSGIVSGEAYVLFYELDSKKAHL